MTYLTITAHQALSNHFNLLSISPATYFPNNLASVKFLILISSPGITEAHAGGKALKEAGYQFDV